MKIKKTKKLLFPQRRLHIGGKMPQPGWEILNANPGPNVDHVRDAKDLSCFADKTFAEIYASHVLEHFDYNIVFSVINEWNRVMKTKGKIYISVPDMDNLSRLVLSEELSLDQRYHVMRMIFGGHVDDYDFHLVGFNFALLENLLLGTGFVNINRVEAFNLGFQDTSTLVYCGLPVSVNVVAEKATAN